MNKLKNKPINLIKGLSKVISSTNNSHTLTVDGYQGELLPDVSFDIPIIQLSHSSKLLFINYYNEFKCMPESVELDFEYINRPMSDLFLDKVIKLNQQGEIEIKIK